MTLFDGLETRTLYIALVVLVALERLVELVIARRNARRLARRGAVEVGGGHYPVMVALHTGLLIAAPLEVWTLERPFVPALALVMLVLLTATMALRYWVIATLGERWTTRVFVVPGEACVARGPYRWLRHPNYLAVGVEIAALPLIHGAWLTALVFSVGNSVLLSRRIRVEERALERSSDYRRTVGVRPRFVPGRRAEERR